MKPFFLFALIISSILLSACSSDNNKNVSCNNSSDYQEFECINHNQFKSADGSKTELSQTIANCTILASTDLPVI
jgi:major membrane immunogen (membrane-anchored lipoprotein)